MVSCISSDGHVAIVTRRSARTIRFITTIKKKRKIVVERTVDFDKYNKLIADDPGKVAEVWLSSPLKMTQEVKKELEMIVGIKKNAFAGKYEDAGLVPTDVEAIAGVEDLNGRTLKSLTALYNKLVKCDPVKAFANMEEATAEVWSALEAYEPPVKEKKEKAVKEKLVLVAVPKHIGKNSVITSVVEPNPRREGGTGHANFANYVVGETIEQFLAKDGAHLGHLRWDISHQFITIDYVDDPAPEPKLAKEKEEPASEDGEKPAKKGKKAKEAPAE